MQCLKSILSSVAAKILIVPVAFSYACLTMLLPEFDDELIDGTHAIMHTVVHLGFGAAVWTAFSQFLLIGAPYLIDKLRVLRIAASCIYISGAVVPVLHLFFYLVDGSYSRDPWPEVPAVPLAVGVVCTGLYVFALVTPKRNAVSTRGNNGVCGP